MLIAGDVGGTKTDLAIYSREAGPRDPLVHKQFPSAEYSSLQAMVLQFLSQTTLHVDSASFAVAGPVVGGRVKTTNLPWVMDEGSIASAIGIDSVHLMNDLEAVARAVPSLQREDVVTLNDGQAVAGGAIAIIAPGTGLGEAFLTFDGAGYTAHASEGGHADFAPIDERQTRLLLYVMQRFGHVGVERVCSGIGVPNVYDFLRDVEKIPESPDITDAISSARDRTRTIIAAGLDLVHPSKRCRTVIDLVTSILAVEAGNLVLKVMATGGVYLAGGVAYHLMNELKQPRFAQTFTNKGRFKDLMERIPVHVITSRAALMGAAIGGL
jgi:glucokinase